MYHFGVRINKIDRYTLLVKQTRRIEGRRYIVDGRRQRVCHIADDAAIAAAVYEALEGRLPVSEGSE